ncbi:hypothetical protein [Roseinatronobacter sp. NSM]|uniref:hypothetical protein n=1 Tax=Roseinatronobacter sp. NSM TaxID=3457785 RepID=UPI004035FFB2
MSDTSLQVHGTDRPPVRKAVQRLRWFHKSFHDQVAQCAQTTGVSFAVDDKKLTAGFIEWLRAFEAQKPQNADSRRAYVGFAAGLMLRTMIRHTPLTATRLPDRFDATDPAYFWPEGYVYVTFCLNIRAAVLEQDFHEDQRLAPELTDLRSWWSFRENIRHDPSLAIAFLDLFAGEVPNWTMSAVFQSAQLRDALGQDRAGRLENQS